MKYLDSLGSVGLILLEEETPRAVGLEGRDLGYLDSFWVVVPLVAFGPHTRTSPCCIWPNKLLDWC